MRLRKFELRNFKGIDAASFEWDDIIVLIGENNVGKSTVLQALDHFLSGSQIRDEALFLNTLTDDAHAIDFIGHFDQLSDAERDAPAIRGRMHGGEWILKKRFWRDAGGADAESRWREQYYSYTSEELFAEWPQNESSWGNFPAAYQPLIEGIPGRGNRPNQHTREVLKQAVRQHRPDLVSQGAPAWTPNPGGGGNWKSNANSVIPQIIAVKAVHDVAEEAVSKGASIYGRIVGLIIERQLMQRPEVQALQAQLNAVLRLFRPDPEHPEHQAPEIRDLEQRINQRLGTVIGGAVTIETNPSDIQPMLLPSTTLALRDRHAGPKTRVGHQGHGLQRTLLITLLQILAELQSAGGAIPGTPRGAVLAIEEPELYMHPQMARKMRDTLYQLAGQPNFQVICTSHSPVFLDVGQRHKSIVRLVKDIDRRVHLLQVTTELFEGPAGDAERERLRLVSTFHPTVNEVFFADRVVLLEEQSAVAAFERGADLTGIFARHPHKRRDVMLIDSQGKGNILLFQKVLNHFRIPYTVIHDEDAGHAAAADNPRIEALLPAAHGANRRHMISPANLEAMLGYAAGKDKVYRALRRVEELHGSGTLPAAFTEALNWIYFGQATEPPAP
jgi:hypothetical protein